MAPTGELLEEEQRAREVERALETLWRRDPERRVYDVFALLDGARDPRIHPFAGRPEVVSRCLYGGDLPAAFARTAPYLVSLSQKAPSTRRLLERSLGHSWGIFLHSDSNLETLREHFRRYLRVQDSAGKSLFFRFFDPRVLRVYLPSCTRKELFDFFGPVRRFLLDGQRPGTLEELSVNQGELRRRLVSLAEDEP